MHAIMLTTIMFIYPYKNYEIYIVKTQVNYAWLDY